MQRESLLQSHCVPLRGAEHRLAGDAMAQLQSLLPDWTLRSGGAEIQREFRFDNYYQTMSFVNALAHIAHREDHHPDLSVHYNRVVVCFSTHDVGGLSRNDLICALKANALVG